MLTALIQGVEGGKWFRLFDKVFSERNLLAAYQQVAKNKGAAGVDHVTAEEFGRQLPENIWQLADSLQADTFHPQAIRRVHIPKPGTNETRPLGIPTVRDRTVQAAIVNVIEPIFERDFAEQSYGFRPGRGCKDALRRVDQLLKAGYVHVVDSDLKGYFDSIPHDRLMTRLREKIADGRVLSLIESFLQAGIIDDAIQWTPEAGAPQGAVTTPPTKVQNFFSASVPGKKGEVDAIDNTNLRGFDHNAFDQRAQNLAAREPIGFIEIGTHCGAELIDAVQRISQGGLFARLRTHLFQQRFQSCVTFACLSQTRFKFLAVDQTIGMNINQTI